MRIFKKTIQTDTANRVTLKKLVVAFDLRIGTAIASSQLVERGTGRDEFRAHAIAESFLWISPNTFSDSESALAKALEIAESALKKVLLCMVVPTQTARSTFTRIKWV